MLPINRLIIHKILTGLFLIKYDDSNDKIVKNPIESKPVIIIVVLLQAMKGKLLIFLLVLEIY